MPEYYFLQDDSGAGLTDAERAELPTLPESYEYGIVSGKAPAGAEVFTDNARLDARVKQADEQAERAVQQSIAEADGEGITPKPTPPRPVNKPAETCPIELPQGVRWPHTAEGKPVTYSYRHDLSQSDLAWLIRCWREFSQWVQGNSRLRLQNVPIGGNIEIGIRSIDGAGRVLGETHIQRQGELIRHAAIYIDRADAMPSRSRAGTHLHEGCHAIGIGHGGGGLMAPQQNAVQTFGQWELAELHARYLTGDA